MKILILVSLIIIVYACNSSADSKVVQDDITEHPDYKRGFDLVTAGKCSTCHQIEGKLTGPSYRDVAKRYAPASDEVVNTLANKIIKGGMGNWGEIYMAPNPVSEEDAKAMVRYILLLK